MADRDHKRKVVMHRTDEDTCDKQPYRGRTPAEAGYRDDRPYDRTCACDRRKMVSEKDDRRCRIKIDTVIHCVRRRRIFVYRIDKSLFDYAVSVPEIGYNDPQK